MISLAGKRFGKLVAQESINDGGEKVKWLCKCDCGNKRIVTYSNLVSGNTKSCGCARAGKIKDITNKRFGHLVVLGKHHSNDGVYWLCKCDCGNETVVRGRSLRSGHTQSCGCGNGLSKKKKNDLYHFYHVWWNVLQRCKNSKSISYYNYGRRGITVCKEWEDYAVFKKDMWEGYRKGLQLDRIDNNKGYCKSNCRWVTPKENARNRNNNTWVTINGIRKTATEWGGKNVVAFLKKHQFDGKTIIEGGKYDNTKFVQGREKRQGERNRGFTEGSTLYRESD